MKYGRDESNKIGGDKKHPSKSKKKINRIQFLKNSCKQAQRDFCKSLMGSCPERPERGGPC
jgi:hypothetical protein